MPQQYHSLTDSMYTDYRQPPPPPPPPPSYQDNFALMYSHSNFQHYHRPPPMPSTGGHDDGGHDYSQQYYSAASNTYGLMPPSYNTTCNMPTFAANNFHSTSYSTVNFHSSPSYSAYENVPTSPVTLKSVKTEPSDQGDHNNIGVPIGGGGGCTLIKNNSPNECRSDRSECSFTSSKLDVCSKSDDALTDLPDNMVGNTEQESSIENNIYQSCGEENVSSKCN